MGWFLKISSELIKVEITEFKNWEQPKIIFNPIHLVNTNTEIQDCLNDISRITKQINGKEDCWSPHFAFRVLRIFGHLIILLNSPIQYTGSICMWELNC